MDGTLISFPDAGCTDQEDELSDVTDCISLAESIALVGDDSREGFIDRSGFPSPRTPDWKFALELDYWVPLPLLDNVKGIYNINIGVSDGYIHDVEGYSEVTKWPTHSKQKLASALRDAPQFVHTNPRACPQFKQNLCDLSHRKESCWRRGQAFARHWSHSYSLTEPPFGSPWERFRFASTAWLS